MRQHRLQQPPVGRRQLAAGGPRAAGAPSALLRPERGEGVGGLDEWLDPAFAKAWTEHGQITTNPDRLRQVELLTAAAAAAADATTPCVLDLACGSGLVTRALLGRGLDVVGIDGSAAMLDLAADATAGATLAQATFEQLAAGAAPPAAAAALARGPFGAITVAQALHEADDSAVRGLLQWVRRPDVLAPGGVLLVLERYELECGGPEAGGVWGAIVAALPDAAPEVDSFHEYAGRYLAGKGDHVRPLAEFEAMLEDEGYESQVGITALPCMPALPCSRALARCLRLRAPLPRSPHPK